jgi:hypothetical protein
MLPGRTDPRWKGLVQDPGKYKDKDLTLPTQMLLSTLKIMARKSSVEEMIETCYVFFKKNERVVSRDIETIFS